MDVSIFADSIQLTILTFRRKSMKIKNLMEYIQENLADGTLNEDDNLYVGDLGERFEVVSLFNDAHQLTISATEY